MINTDTPNYDQLLERARHSLSELDLEQALSSYLAAQSLEPDSFDVQLGLTRTYTRMRRRSEAVAAADKALALRPDSYEAHSVSGALHFLIDENEQAIAQLEQAIELAPSQPEPRLTLAQVYGESKRFSDADAEIAKSRELIEAMPDEKVRSEWEALAWHVETYVRLAQGKRAQAMEAAQHVLALQESNPYAACLAYSNLGILQARSRKYDQAIEYFEKAFELNPFFYRAGTALGRLLIMRNQATRAAEVMEQVLKHADTANGSTRYAYAAALGKLQKRQEAREQYALALKEGLTGIEGIMARWQMIWQSDVGRYTVIGVILALILVWLVAAKPSPQALTFIGLLAVILILQRTVGRRGR